MNKQIQIEVDKFGKHFFFNADVSFKESLGEKGSIGIPDTFELEGINSFDVLLEEEFHNKIFSVEKKNCTEKSNPLVYKVLIKALEEDWDEVLMGLAHETF